MEKELDIIKELNIITDKTLCPEAGNIYGIYTLIGKCKEPYKCGTDKYVAKCNICGKISYNILARFKQPVKKCIHLNPNNIMRENYTWSNKRIRNIFRGMVARCYNENQASYSIYGGKGIKICDEWLDYPPLFEEWSLSNGYESNLTIDRIDSNKNYCPENCRWVTLSDNAKYKSATRIITVDGVSHTGNDWSRICKIGLTRINTLYRKYGEEVVINFIRERLKDTSLVPAHNQSYLDLYGIDTNKNNQG